MGKCCGNCFIDNDIIAIVKTNSFETGDCDYCGSKNVALLAAEVLEEQFQMLIEVYSPLPAGIKGHLLFEKINIDWGNKIFKISDAIILEKFLQELCPHSFISNPRLFQQPVDFHPDLKIKAEEHELKWDQFAIELKEKNRFFIRNTIDLILLERLFARHIKIYKVGSTFYRARISDKVGFPKEKMGKPPKENSKTGQSQSSWNILLICFGIYRHNSL